MSHLYVGNDEKGVRAVVGLLQELLEGITNNPPNEITIYIDDNVRDESISPDHPRKRFLGRSIVIDIGHSKEWVSKIRSLKDE